MEHHHGESWTIDHSIDTYQIDRWGDEFFSIGENGHIMVHPNPGQDIAWDLVEIVNQGLAQDLTPPVLIRLPGIIRARIQQLYAAFRAGREKYGYRGKYTLVFPIKVNQHQEVLDAVYASGAAVDGAVGMEAGSKAEMMAALCKADNQTPVFCNGFKDDTYIELAVRAFQLGRNVTIIIEKPHEIKMVADCVKRLGVCPRLGVRVKLAARVSGHWQSSAGSSSKFGLSTSQLLEGIDQLREFGLIHRLELMHFHPGSQINNVRHIKASIIEATRIYGDLYKQGIPLNTVDVGGGLAVDYTGNRNTEPSSMNYTLQEYANDVVYYMQQVCNQMGVPHPDIVSESGRAVAAHHGVLVVPVLGAGQPTRQDGLNLTPEEEKIPPLFELQGNLAELNEDNVLEVYHDGQQAVEMALQLFANGHMTLDQRVKAERMFYALCQRVREMLEELEFIPKELEELSQLLADTYYANFSLFQSLPDNWAIDQLFPLMPIHRLLEKPTAQGTLGDITCDSDGCIINFVGPNGKRKTLPLHAVQKEEPYWLGIFLVGAYQEVLGDYHNLLGRLHVLTVDADANGRLMVFTRRGTVVSEALELVNHTPEDVMRGVRSMIHSAVSEKRVTTVEAQSSSRFFQRLATEYTYLTDDLDPIAEPETLRALTDSSRQSAIHAPHVTNRDTGGGAGNAGLAEVSDIENEAMSTVSEGADPEVDLSDSMVEVR